MIAYAESKKVEIRLTEGKVRLSGSPQNVAHVADALKQFRDELLRWFQQAVAGEKTLAAGHLVLQPERQPSKKYYSHHFVCPTCISAGKIGGLRCFTGLDLWGAYLQSSSNRADS